ncbi:hypothetical protein [Paractinoplanes rishiriensis]|uniref:Uncharacterized protein n=1 Tax=Paractinoplanes rishiriensis TaxID=1050105 RepID=A0A919K3J6_9ACTN|nr:hypothetical protein [Actinoplanes rishiriensis]GIE98187.1 hypothetical protein Ari01nite_56520 [Actinoplanes rishiriensis]
MPDTGAEAPADPEPAGVPDTGADPLIDPGVLEPDSAGLPGTAAGVLTEAEPWGRALPVGRAPLE